MSERLFIRLPDDPPCAPGTTVPASTLRAFSVPAALQSAVAHVTAYEELFEDGLEVIERVLPDGASRILIVLHDDAASMHVAGASASPVLLPMRGHMHGLSITLHPGATLGLFNVPANELAGCTVHWNDLVPNAHRDLPEQLAAAGDDTMRVRLVLNALDTLHRPSDPTALRLVAHAAGQLRTHSGGLSVRSLAGRLNLSERRLQQVFASQVGLPPSVWRRLHRLQRTLRLLRTTQAPQWAEVAICAGYYDQSHLINEFRDLCGLTPQQFLRRTVSDFSNTAVGLAAKVGAVRNPLQPTP